jgi:hypothetical protein
MKETKTGHDTAMTGRWTLVSLRSPQSRAQDISVLCRIVALCRYIVEAFEKCGGQRAQSSQSSGDEFFQKCLSERNKINCIRKFIIELFNGYSHIVPNHKIVLILIAPSVELGQLLFICIFSKNETRFSLFSRWISLYS